MVRCKQGPNNAVYLFGSDLHSNGLMDMSRDAEARYLSAIRICCLRNVYGSRFVHVPPALSLAALKVGFQSTAERSMGVASGDIWCIEDDPTGDSIPSSKVATG